MRSIDRKKAVVLSLALLALVSLPVSANTIGAIGSIHQSDADFGEAALENMTISGTGNDASVVLDGETDGSTAETSFHGSIGTNFQAAAGVMIKPNDDLAGLRINLASGSEATMAELRQGDGTTIERTSISEGSAEFSADLNAGEEYQVVADADGSEYAASFDDDPSLPYISENVDITNGVVNEQATDDTVYNIDTVTAVVSGGSGEYVSQSHFVDDSTGVSANIGHIQDSDASLIVEEWDGSDWHVLAEKQGITTEGQTTLEWDEDASSQLRTRVAVDPTDVNNEFELEQEAILFDDSEPQLTSAEPNTEEVITDSPVQLSIDVEDADFDTSQGDEVTVEFFDASDDSQIGTDTLTSNGTASATFNQPVGGENNWYVIATDDYGNEVTSSTFTFNAPAEIEVRDEEDPDQLLTDVDDMTIEFYQQTGGNPDAIETVNVSNGTADMTGLQADASFIAVAEADGFDNRRIYIDSLIETQTIYLLNENADSVTVEYELEDFSGDYPQAETIMVIEKNLNDEWTPIQGDFFGSTGKFEAQLLRDTRHRMRVVNVETGDHRVIGAYTPTQDALETVTISPDGSITVDDGFEQIFAQPAIGSISASEAAEFGVELREGEEVIESWEIEVILMQNATETTLATRSGEGASVETFDLDLREAAGGSVIANVDYETATGSGTVQLSRSVRENYPGSDGLVGGLITIGDGLGVDGDASGASMLASLFVSLLISAGVARISTSADVIGIAALMSVAGFAIIGWLPFTVLFAAAVGFGAVIVLRRGI